MPTLKWITNIFWYRGYTALPERIAEEIDRGNLVMGEPRATDVYSAAALESKDYAGIYEVKYAHGEIVNALVPVEADFMKAAVLAYCRALRWAHQDFAVRVRVTPDEWRAFIAWLKRKEHQYLLSIPTFDRWLETQ